MNFRKLLAICCMIIPIIGISQNKTESEFKIFDSNNDDKLSPYEVFDIFLMMKKENKEDISLKEFSKVLARQQKEQDEEIEEILEELDENENGIIEFSEADEEMLSFLVQMDTDNNEAVTREELNNFNPEDSFFLSDKDLKKEIKLLFKNFTKSNSIVLNNLNDTIRMDLAEWDWNRDGEISKQEAFDYLKPNNMTAQFAIKGDTAYMSGVISSGTPAKILELIFEHPNVETIEMLNVPGSIDDVANLRASLYIHKFGFNTQLNERSMIASGGTDFFLAGKERSVTKGAKIGVHSWAGGGKTPTELSRKDKAHKKYLDYYQVVNIPEDFYWYTLDAAPAEQIHYMTEQEIEKFKISTDTKEQ